MNAPDLDTLLSRLAVSGRFDPVTLFAHLPDDQTETLAAQLAELCEEVLSGGHYRWLLRAPARRQALARLVSRNSLRDAIAAAPPAEPDDLFAEMLRAALTGKLRVAEADSAKAEARQAALQFARHVPASALQSASIQDALERTRTQIALQEREDALSIVFARTDKLFGRKDELQWISEFVTGTSDTRPLLITGIGGVGKSTLLAAVIRRWARQKHGPAVVLLDFDRPALASGEPIEIVREFTRQLAIEWSSAKEHDKSLRQVASRILRDQRARMIATREDGKVVRRIDAEEQFKGLLSVAFAEFRDNIPQALRTTPIVLLLDTFEVVGRQGPVVTERALDLERFLREQGGFTALRTIVSGRGIPLERAMADRRFGPPERQIVLEGLKDEAAAAFLAARDRKKRFRSKKLRLQAARALKGHPLALLVLERYARPRSEVEVAELLSDVHQDTGFSAEFAQTFLYARILERISEPQVKQLAHPGLVLRQVTPGLIRLVLAGACGIGSTTVEQSIALFQKLKSEYWLVEVISDELVRHRPDLRRLMLPGLFAGPRPEDAEEAASRKRELKHAALAVCQEASRFYRDGPRSDDPARAFWDGLGPRARRAEQIYYEALSGAPAPAELSRDVAVDLSAQLREDIDTLPAAWRAVVKAAGGETLGLDEDEISTLGGALRSRAETARIDSDLTHGQTARAQQRTSAERARRSAERPSRRVSADDLELVEKEVLARWAEADMPGVLRVGQPLLDTFARGVVTDATSRSANSGRLWETALWKFIMTHPRPAVPPRDEPQTRLPPWSLHLLGAAMGRPGSALSPAPHPDFLQRMPDRSSEPPPGLDRTRMLAVRIRRREVERDASLEVAADTLALAAPLLVPELASLSDGVGLTWARSTARPRSGQNDPVAALRKAGIRFGPKVTAWLMQRETGGWDLRELEQVYLTKEQVAFGTSGTEPKDSTTMQTTPDAWGHALLPFLRGLTPELHVPVSNLLAGKPAISANELSDLLTGLNPRWPAALIFGAQGTTFTARHALPLAETADRFGLLRPTLEYLAQQQEQEAPVRLLSFYDAVTERLFTSTKPVASA